MAERYQGEREEAYRDGTNRPVYREEGGGYVVPMRAGGEMEISEAEMAAHGLEVEDLVPFADRLEWAMFTYTAPIALIDGAGGLDEKETEAARKRAFKDALASLEESGEER